MTPYFSCCIHGCSLLVLPDGRILFAETPAARHDALIRIVPTIKAGMLRDRIELDIHKHNAAAHPEDREGAARALVIHEMAVTKVASDTARREPLEAFSEHVTSALTEAFRGLHFFFVPRRSEYRPDDDDLDEEIHNIRELGETVQQLAAQVDPVLGAQIRGLLDQFDGFDENEQDAETDGTTAILLGVDAMGPIVYLLYDRVSTEEALRALEHVHNPRMQPMADIVRERLDHSTLPVRLDDRQSVEIHGIPAAILLALFATYHAQHRPR